MRLFLAMLALVAGLASMPAQARMTPADVSELERVEGSRASSGSAIAAATAEAQAQSRSDRRDRDRVRARRPATVIVLIPSIQYGDRSLE